MRWPALYLCFKMVEDLRIPAALVRHLVKCLKHTFIDGFYADKVLEKLFKSNRKLGSRDRRFLATTLYDMVRWWERLKVYTGIHDPQTDKDFLAYWFGFELWKNKRNVADYLEGAIERDELTEIDRRIKQSTLQPWEEVSFPQWLYEKVKEDYGAGCDKILTSLNDPAPVCLRTNELKTGVKALKSELAAEGISTIY